MTINYVSDKQKIADRSIPQKKLTSGVISTDKACMWIDGSNAAIFNYSVPYNRYYIDGVETDTVTISKGDSFVDADCYLEGIESTYAMMMQCMGYPGGNPPVVSEIKNTCGSCESAVGAECTVISTHSIKVSGTTSGDVTYRWEVEGGGILEGQDTDTIRVVTVGIYSMTVFVKCTVSDNYEEAVRETSCVHERDNVGETLLVPHPLLKPKLDLVPNTGEIDGI